MKRTLIIIVVMVLVTAAAGLARMPVKPKAGKQAEKDVKALAKSNTTFALAMYKQLTLKEKGNLFFSPASIHTALGMTYAGARGETAKQMYDVLAFPKEYGKVSSELIKNVSWTSGRLHGTFGELVKQLNTPKLDHKKKPAYQLSVANALWGQDGFSFKEDYTSLVKKHYGAGLNNVNFGKTEAARKKINDWVEDKTNKKIKDLIPRGVLSRETRLVLTNAVYFKSNWAHTFKMRNTKDGKFNVSADKHVTASLMYQQKKFNYMETEQLQALELPYNRNDLSMIVLLPRKIGALAAMEKSLTAESLDKWLSGMKRESVKVTLPKFKFTSQFGLTEPLKAMGMTDAFSSEKADFSGMTTAEQLFISAVLHKAFVAVDEKGTEAAAATAVVISRTSVEVRPREPKVFKADHPFLFVIRHNATGEVLFFGRVVNPAKQ